VLYEMDWPSYILHLSATRLGGTMRWYPTNVTFMKYSCRISYLSFWVQIHFSPTTKNPMDKFKPITPSRKDVVVELSKSGCIYTLRYIRI
jgi:hypothetical protein